MDHQDTLAEDTEEVVVDIHQEVMEEAVVDIHQEVMEEVVVDTHQEAMEVVDTHQVHHHSAVAHHSEEDMAVHQDGLNQCHPDGPQAVAVVDTHQVVMEEVFHPHTVSQLHHTVHHQVAHQDGVQVVHGNQQHPSQTLIQHTKKNFIHRLKYC